MLVNRKNKFREKFFCGIYLFGGNARLAGALALPQRLGARSRMILFGVSPTPRTAELRLAVDEKIARRDDFFAFGNALENLTVIPSFAADLHGSMRVSSAALIDINSRRIARIQDRALAHRENRLRFDQDSSVRIKSVQ